MAAEERCWYHGTSSSLARKILAEGLKPTRDVYAGKRCVWLTPDFEHASWYCAIRVLSELIAAGTTTRSDIAQAPNGVVFEVALGARQKPRARPMQRKEFFLTTAVKPSQLSYSTMRVVEVRPALALIPPVAIDQWRRNATGDGRTFSDRDRTDREERMAEEIMGELGELPDLNAPLGFAGMMDLARWAPTLSRR
jgi:hypothetical protein